VEQLLMTPASTTDIVVAKIAPLFALLIVMSLLAIGIMRLFFAVPVRGSMLLLILSAALCILCGIGIGTFVATFTKSAQQSQMTAFFINPPLATLSVSKPCRPGCNPSPGSILSAISASSRAPR
jgi:ABC-2 type transport system permease protein